MGISILRAEDNLWISLEDAFSGRREKEEGRRKKEEDGRERCQYLFLWRRAAMTYSDRGGCRWWCGRPDRSRSAAGAESGAPSSIHAVIHAVIHVVSLPVRSPTSTAGSSVDEMPSLKVIPSSSITVELLRSADPNTPIPDLNLNVQLTPRPPRHTDDECPPVCARCHRARAARHGSGSPRAEPQAQPG